MSVIRKLFPFFKKKTFIEFTDPEGASLSLANAPQTTVLDTLLNNGVKAPYSCKAGLCRSCTMQCTNPENLPPHSQKGLSPAEIELGYFLPCSCLTDKPLSIAPITENSQNYTVTVIEKVFVSGSVMKLKLDSPFEFKGGQFCNLFKTEELCRSYSIASQDNADHLEFHIKHLPNGEFSGWAAESLQKGDEITVQGPFGECFYIDTKANKQAPILMSGIGTGLAPLIGVIKTALASGHEGKIDLVIGAKHSSNFYLLEELFELEKKHLSLSVHLLASQLDSNAHENVQAGDIYDYIDTKFGTLNNYQVYLCGAPSFIQKMKKQCFLAGASMSAIFSDIFQPAS